MTGTDSNVSFDNISLKTKEKAKCFSSVLPLKSLLFRESGYLNC